MVSQTTYNYDEGNVTSFSSTPPQHIAVSGSRGNLTSVDYPAGGLVSRFTYYDTGGLRTAQDVNAAVTTYNYSDANNTCGWAYPTGITKPVGNPALSQSYTWNCTGGVQTSVTDENGKFRTTAYANDPYYWRPDSVTDPTNATVTFCYGLLSNSTGTCARNATQVESTLNFNSNNSTVDSLLTVDSLGRPHVGQTRQSPSSTSFDSSETDYDALGRPNRSTLPYSGTSGQTNSSAPAVTTAYDALGRVSSVTDSASPVHGSITYTYSNNDMLVTVGPAPAGENRKQRQLEYDALGRLTSVCEITAGTTAWPGASCGQNTSATGYLAKYTYDALGNLLTVTQNAQSSSNQQTRSYSWDAISRLTAETNPESGTVTYSYDVVPSGCSSAGTSYPGDLTRRLDAAGNGICNYYDALHRLTDVGSPTGCKRFRYDNTTGVTGTIPAGVSVSNVLGRLAEAETDACSLPITPITDEWFSYTARGETSDVYESTPHSSGYYHLTQTYWPHGAPDQLSGLTGLPTITYGGTIGSTVGLDGEGRITQVTAGSGQNPVSGVTYNSASLPLLVNFGSGDNDIFAYDSNTLRMTQFKFNVGTQSQYFNGALTWNANGSLSQLAVTDQFNSADTQTCNYSHDDLERIAQVDCGTGGWGQAFGYLAGQNAGYDPFGNLTKAVLSNHTGNSFQATYNSATNRFSSLPGCSGLSYDSNGNVTNDCNHTYSWDAYGNSVAVDGVGLTFDASDRMVEQNRSGSYTQIAYRPGGGKLALMNGQSLVKAFVPLPGQAVAVYTSSGLDHYRHSDWLGSARLTSSASRAYTSSVAYAPFGETYAQSGTADLSFTGQNSDTTSGDYDFLFREYSNEGRWVSPDPAGRAAVDPSNPQSWNRYAYVQNNPLSHVDPLGLILVYLEWDGGGGYFDSDALIAAGFDIQFDENGDVSSIDPPSGGIAVVDSSGNQVGFIGADLNLTAGVAEFSQTVTVTPDTNNSPSPTWAAIKAFFTLPSTGPGSCLAVFSNSVQGSVGSAGKSLGRFVQQYGPALASGLAGSGLTAVQAQEVVGAMAAGGQLSPGVAALATNTIAGIAETTTAAAPFVVQIGGATALGLFDAALLKGVHDEGSAALKGQCKP